jgi:hypothetical protein
MPRLDELELLQELGHPINGILVLVRHGDIDSLNDTLGVILEVFTVVYPTVATLRLVAGAHRVEETVEEALCDTLLRVARVDVHLQLERISVRAALVTVIVKTREAHDFLCDVLLRTPLLVAFGDGDNVRELLRGDGVDTLHELLDSARPEFWSTDTLGDVVVVELLKPS